MIARVKAINQYGEAPVSKINVPDGVLKSEPRKIENLRVFGKGNHQV